MSRHRIANRAKAARARAAGRRGRSPLQESVAGWLGVGALTLGMGAAVLAGGSGVAYADSSNDAATTKAAADGDADSAAPRSKASTARSAGSARAVRHENSSSRGSSVSADRSVARVATPAAGAVRSAAAVNTSRRIVVPTAGADTAPTAAAAAAPTVRRPLDRSASVVPLETATANTATVNSVAAATVRQSPVQALVGVVVNALVALGGMDRVTPEPAPGNLWQLGLYSVARWLANTTNPGGIPKVETTTIGPPDPETGVVAGRVVFTTASGAPVTYRVSTDPTQGTVTVNADGSYSFTPLQSTRVGAPDGGITVKMYVTAYNGVQSSKIVADLPVANVFNLLRVTIPVGLNPAGLALSPNGQIVVAANAGGDTISVISTSTNGKLTPDIAVGDNPLDVAFTPDGSAVYVSNNVGESVSRVSLADYTVTTIPVGQLVGDIAMGVANSPSAGRLYVLDQFGPDTLVVIDTSTNTVLPGALPVSNQIRSLAMSPDGTRIFLTDTASDSVVVVDTASFAVTTTIPIPVGDPTSSSLFDAVMSPDGEYLYALITSNTAGDNFVWQIDLTTNTVIAPSIPVGVRARSMAFSPDSSVLYVTNQWDDTISAISTATNTVIKTINNVPNPGDLVVTANRIYVSNGGFNTVTAILV